MKGSARAAPKLLCSNSRKGIKTAESLCPTTRKADALWNPLSGGRGKGKGKPLISPGVRLLDLSNPRKPSGSKEERDPSLSNRKTLYIEVKAILRRGTRKFLRLGLMCSLRPRLKTQQARGHRVNKNPNQRRDKSHPNTTWLEGPEYL